MASLHQQRINRRLSHWPRFCTFFFVVSVLALGCVSAKKLRRQSRGAIQMNLTQTTGDLQCRRGDQIINVTIVSRDTDDCQGVPSKMFVDQCNCYWNERCTLKFDPTDYIIPSWKHSCPGRRVNALDVSYTCKPAARITLFHSTKWPRKEGILRSHTIFPWDDRGHLASVKRSISVGHRNRLVVTMYPYDLGLNQMSIGNHTFTGQSSQPVTIVFNRYTVVYFDFINNESDSDAKGFVICYKVFKIKKPYRNQTACELIKRGGKKSRSRKQKNKSQKRKSRKKKNKKRNPKRNKKNPT